MNLYHYRSIHTALLEIENGTFHYSDRKELNDPLEGHIQMYWQGDRPAWQGLFRNYICSLCNCIELYLLQRSFEEIDERAVMLDVHDMDDTPFGRLLGEVGDLFLADPDVSGMIDELARSDEQVFARSLRFRLQLLHEKAFAICMRSMKWNGLIPQDEPEDYIPTEKSLANLYGPDVSKIDSKARNALLEVAAHMLEDVLESRFLKEEMESENSYSQRQLWYSVRLWFPAMYVSRLREMMYQKAYVVCFSAEPANSVMWGNYAENHSGVCLVYETKTKDGREYLGVKTGKAYTSGHTIFSFRDDEVKPVRYNNAPIKRNAFESMGRLSLKQVSSWLVNSEGEKSRLYDRYMEENWRDTYWDDYTDKYCTKLDPWAYEKEYRLRLDDFLHEHTWEERMVEYDPAALTGVIFGVRTSEYDRQRIIKAIQKSGRSLKEFNFFQCEFDDEAYQFRIRRKMI